MNQKETDRAIKAAVDQAKKVKPIEYTIKKGNSFKKSIDAYWKRRNENTNYTRNRSNHHVSGRRKS
jgi:hypothetical protein